MNEPILSFEEILRKEEYILVDTSVSSNREDSGWYVDGIRDVKSYSEINKGILRAQIAGMEFFSSVIENPHVYTSEGVPAEFMRGRDMIERKIKNLDYLGHSKKHVRRRVQNGGRRKGNAQRELMIKIGDLFYQTSCQAKESILPVLEPEQRELYSYLKILFLKSQDTPVQKLILAIVIIILVEKIARTCIQMSNLFHGLFI